MNVYTMTYEHRHGQDSAVFAHRADAEAEVWRLMANYRDELDDLGLPVTLAKLDAKIEARDLAAACGIWLDLSGESFLILEHELLGFEPRHSEEDDALYGRAKEVFASSRELSVVVQEIKVEEASAINQSGLDAQIRYLFESGHRDRLERALHERVERLGW